MPRRRRRRANEELEAEPVPGDLGVLPPGLLPDRPWVARALCAGMEPEVFFPEGVDGPALLDVANAKAVCANCPVREECLDWALRIGEAHGIWGGTTPSERRMLRRARVA